MNYTYGWRAPQPGGDHDADAATVVEYWESLGITVRTVVTDGDPTVFATGGPIQSISFITAAPGDYYISGTSRCVPGDANELRKQETTE